jgi:hypothetical protein
MHRERLDRLAALRRLLDSWDARFGPVSAESMAEAKAAFDELDGLGEHQAERPPVGIRAPTR